MLAVIFQRAAQRGLIDTKPEGAIDSTGLETHHVSAYFVDRRGYTRFRRRRWPKLTLVCHTHSHLIAAANVVRGPCNDHRQFAPAMRQAVGNICLARLLADTGYDSEGNHVLCRKKLGIRSTVIPLNPRNTGRRWPKTRYRRQMKRRFHKGVYGNRWQVESVISRYKRRLDSALRARNYSAQKQECLLRVLTHDLMIVKHVA